MPDPTPPRDAPLTAEEAEEALRVLRRDALEDRLLALLRLALLRGLRADNERLRTALVSIDLKLEVARLGLDRNGPQHRRIAEAREIARAALEAAGDPARRTGEAG